MELTNGRDMGPIINELKCDYSEEFCKYSLYRTVKGLVDLHSQNIIHRDIRSDNIVVNEIGEIKLADFGLSTILT